MKHADRARGGRTSAPPQRGPPNDQGPRLKRKQYRAIALGREGPPRGSRPPDSVVANPAPRFRPRRPPVASRQKVHPHVSTSKKGPEWGTAAAFMARGVLTDGVPVVYKTFSGLPRTSSPSAPCSTSRSPGRPLRRCRPKCSSPSFVHGLAWHPRHGGHRRLQLAGADHARPRPSHRRPWPWVACSFWRSRPTAASLTLHTVLATRRQATPTGPSPTVWHPAGTGGLVVTCRAMRWWCGHHPVRRPWRVQCQSALARGGRYGRAMTGRMTSTTVGRPRRPRSGSAADAARMQRLPLGFVAGGGRRGGRGPCGSSPPSVLFETLGVWTVIRLIKVLPPPAPACPPDLLQRHAYLWAKSPRLSSSCVGRHDHGVQAQPAPGGRLTRPWPPTWPGRPKPDRLGVGRVPRRPARGGREPGGREQAAAAASVFPNQVLGPAASPCHLVCPLDHPAPFSPAAQSYSILAAVDGWRNAPWLAAGGGCARKVLACRVRRTDPVRAPPVPAGPAAGRPVPASATIPSPPLPGPRSRKYGVAP